ncbi:MAG: YkgJ family cysteine cluster protein [bacterium]
MKIETDLELIKKMGILKEKENMEFRVYLKNMSVGTKKMDRLVHKINDEVTSQIDCTLCANCCKITTTCFDEEDVAKFSAGLNQNIEQFKTTYLIPSEDEEGCYDTNILPCPFLEDNKCSNYINRPKECKSYPHLQNEEFTFRLFGVVANYSRCPIVYNVYEKLKQLLWRKDWR